ncbi:MAG: hypothetical protein L6R42_010839, partial [Xanthoria sp. 1 TBL-2021]
MAAPSSSVTKTTVHQATNAPETPTSSPSPIRDAPAHPPKPANPANPSHPEAAKPAAPAQKPAEAAAQPKKPSNKSSSSPINHSGSHWAMTYSPYTPSGDCKSSSDIATDVAAIAAKGFSSLRLYSTD